MSTAIATTGEHKPALNSGGRIAAIVPTNAEQAFRLAQMIAQSGMAPQGMNRPEQIMIAVMHGMEIGLPPMQAVQSIAVVNGRPTLWGDGMIALVRGSGLCEYVTETMDGEGDRRRATCRAKRVGEPGPVERSFSVEDAKAAGLWGKGGPWKQYPARMLQMRARGFALRDAFADVLRGLQMREEAMDVRPYDAPAVVEPITAAKMIEQSRATVAEPEPEVMADDEDAGHIDAARAAAANGTEAFRAHWSAASADARAAMKPIMDELKASAAKADAATSAPSWWLIRDGEAITFETASDWLDAVDAAAADMDATERTAWLQSHQAALADAHAIDPEAASKAVEIMHAGRIGDG